MGGAQGPGTPAGAGGSTGQPDPDGWRELLRGGEDVAQVMSDMANILDEISGLEGRDEEELPIRDRRLLARLLLAREEARSLMAGGIQDPRNDVRRLKNVPETEVRFISTLVAIKAPDALKKRIFDVMDGREEGEYKKGSDGPIKVQGSKGSAPVRPGHLLDTITKVLGGMYRTGGSGVTVQQLEWIRKETLDALQRIGFSQ
ncbi:hypothetical protein CLOP_g10234 [Closterium sp. NIES-67]|nr:hypothetical protein CLOP_g10234 [Closterium sp. NIES-67]